MRVTPYDADQHAGLVYGSWLSGYRDSPQWTSQHADTYFPYQRALIRDLLRRSVCLVADDEGVLAGYAVVERQGHALILHWVSVKRAYRGDGLARLLIAGCLAELDETSADDLVYTHVRPPFSSIFDEAGWRYRPKYLGSKERAA